MSDQRSVFNIAHWMLPIVLSFVATAFGYAVTWGGIDKTIKGLEVSEVKNTESRAQVRVNTDIIFRLGATVDDTAKKLDKFVDRYNDNREQDQKVLREILIAVKQ